MILVAGPYRSGSGGDPERIAANVGTAYREFDPGLPPLTPPEQLVRMAGWFARH